MTATAVESDDDGRVRTLTLNRPERLNAFTASSYRVLAALSDAAGDDDVAVVLLTGAGRAFCSGVDPKDMASAADDGDDLSDGFVALINALLEFPKPLIAAVPFTQLGTAPEAGSSWLLPRAIGAQRAAELVLTSRWLEAAEAVEWGLAARSCPPDDLHHRATQLAHQIAAHSSAATRAAKQLLRCGRSVPVRAALSRERGEASALRDLLGSIDQNSGPGTRTV